MHLQRDVYIQGVVLHHRVQLSETIRMKNKNKKEERNTHEYKCSNTQHEETNEKKKRNVRLQKTRDVLYVVLLQNIIQHTICAFRT